MAIEFLPEAQQQKVYLCEAPLVEGAIARFCIDEYNHYFSHVILVTARDAIAQQANEVAKQANAVSNGYSLFLSQQ